MFYARVFIFLFFAFISAIPSKAHAAETVKRDWGLSVFPAIEDFNLLQLYLNWDKSFQSALDEAKMAGMPRTLIAKTWKEIDDKPEDIRKLMQQVRERDIDIFYGLQLINTVKREVPEDLEQEPWDSDLMYNRVVDTLNKTLPLLDPQRLSYLSFGNEVDVYFDRNPGEIAAYKRLFDKVLAYIHAHYPNIKTGITTTFDSYYRGKTDLIEQIQQNTDIIIMTYYPIEPDKARPPTAPYDDLKTIAEFANGREVVLQEAGYPSDPAAGSSEDAQAQFIHNLFAAWDQYPDTFSHINIFLQTDFGTRVCNQLTDYYGFGSMKEFFRANICSLGLKDAHGRPKKAWSALAEEAAKIR